MKNIVIIEDDSALRTILNKHIESMGFNAVEFSNPVPSIEYLKDHGGEVDLIILDIMMPLMNGYEFMDKLNGHRYQIIVLTALETRRVKEEMKFRGLKEPLAIITKPITREDLSRVVLQYTEKKLETQSQRLDVLLNENIEKEIL